MRLLPGFSLPFVLELLLVGTTPTGTGAGLHQFDLVHPLFAHVHIAPVHAVGVVWGRIAPRLAITLRRPAGRILDAPPDPPPTLVA